ncbi:hypothetical protein H7347_09450 [Corynebacterium sp. zg-331]|uniref:hypothetical protein n=1 Tax=unclassified Corynebacterium TaxID=2624378 RepID=UPI00128BA16A|nr:MULTISPECIES: hypothetical protein [unclassified Corynebacterium]MBC3186787.1 hypothetical protein [Corynebacterium sp. zg-331]MPV53268.1 hypothetical protein [Corynebacterium sp. zg331]
MRHAPGTLGRRSTPPALPVGAEELYRRALRSANITDARPPEVLSDGPAPMPAAAAVSLRQVSTHRYVATTADSTVRLGLDIHPALGGARLRDVWPKPGALPRIAPTLYTQLRRRGIAYVEAAVALYDARDATTAAAYVDAGMRPVAYYPAARARAGCLHDLMILAHSADTAALLPVKELTVKEAV